MGLSEQQALILKEKDCIRNTHEAYKDEVKSYIEKITENDYIQDIYYLLQLEYDLNSEEQELLEYCKSIKIDKNGNILRIHLRGDNPLGIDMVYDYTIDEEPGTNNVSYDELESDLNIDKKLEIRYIKKIESVYTNKAIFSTFKSEEKFYDEIVEQLDGQTVTYLDDLIEIFKYLISECESMNENN